MFGRKGGPPPATQEPGPFLATADQPLEVALRDPVTGREVRLGVLASLRDLEVLGSAGMFYGDSYANPDRPQLQVRARKMRAKRIGQALWTAAVDRCGIEEPQS